MLDFPLHVYTLDEFNAARKAIASGYKHRLTITGSQSFRQRAQKILCLIELAGYSDYLRTYIREIKEVDGLGQLREAEATIWLNSFHLADPIEGARFVIQKANQMQAYLEGKPWYILGELPAVRASIEFLRQLSMRLKDQEERAQCDEAIRKWTEDKVT